MAVALILGASGTLGGAIARELIARRYDVGLHYHSTRGSCEKLTSQGSATRIQFYPADFNDTAAPQVLATAVLKEFSRVDALVWASGIVHDAPLLILKEDDLRAQLNVNLKALFLTLKAFSRQFIKQKSGAVVALSSHAGVSGRMGGTAYAMSHAGILALIKSAAREWGAMGVRVNAVLPPFVPGSGMGRGATPEFFAKVKAARVLKIDSDGAAVVARFVADLIENPAISGQVLSVDSRII
ncbi:MAG: SDR family NAD(P)-dependent oxidoreductase [Planctomycetota bacterium]